MRNSSWIVSVVHFVIPLGVPSTFLQDFPGKLSGIPLGITAEIAINFFFPGPLSRIPQGVPSWIPPITTSGTSPEIALEILFRITFGISSGFFQKSHLKFLQEFLGLHQKFSLGFIQEILPGFLQIIYTMLL